MSEYIMCSALWIQDDKPYVHQPTNVDMGYVVAGQRHHNCFMTIHILAGCKPKNVKQGSNCL